MRIFVNYRLQITLFMIYPAIYTLFQARWLYTSFRRDVLSYGEYVLKKEAYSDRDRKDGNGYQRIP